MKKLWIMQLLLWAWLVSCMTNKQDAELFSAVPEGAQAISKLGKTLYPAAANETALANYAAAKKEYEANPDDADKIIWFGRRAAYAGDYREAIRTYTEGIEKFPSDARFYRHRGHRYISIREFDRAIDDFERAAQLVEGTEDKIEPDGQPNALGIPISSLHSNINYHLGLAYYLTYDLEQALEVYRRDVAQASNDDKLVSVTHWLYMTLRLLGRDAEARDSLKPIHQELKIIENMVYHRLCLFYKGELSLEELTGENYTDVTNDALAYGIGNWHFYNGEKAKAREVFERIISEGAWASFGYIAAEADYARSFASGPADLVIRNAKVFTVDKDRPYAGAIAFKGEWIIAVCSDEEIEQYIQSGFTKVIDAKGRLVTPGFNDAHIHFRPIDPDYIELRYITDPKIITEKVREAVAQAEPGELIRGGHWEHEMFDNRQWPTKELLDAVSPNNPVALSRADSHSMLVNSYVLNNSGITKDTKAPFGGEIQRDPVTGEATGIFKESARELLKYGEVKKVLTVEEQDAELLRQWQVALDLAARTGVTSIHVPREQNLAMYQRMQELGTLTLRIYGGPELPENQQQLQQCLELQKKFPPENNWIRFGYLKFTLDGTLGSGTAFFFEPYEDEPGNLGLPQLPYDEFERRIIAADRAGFQLGVHAIGSQTNHWVLNAFQKAQELNGKRDSRHRVEHAQILIDEDIPRFAELGVIASMQPTHCITDKRFAEKRVGWERCRGAYAWQRLLQTGAQIAFGTDYSVEPIDPMEGLYAAVTRKDRMGEEGDGWFPDQKLSMEKAIELYTLGPAYAEFMEDRKGMIKEGYLGDVVIVNQDLLTIPPAQIMQAKVDYTIVGGKVVYQRDGAN